MLARVHSRSLLGLHAPAITIEVHLSTGLPSITMVGLPETAVKESKDRVRSAIINAGFDFPSRRMTISLAPADLPKDGARLDLPIAVGILAASGQVSMDALDKIELIGELSLGGALCHTCGELAFALAAKDSGRTLILPMQNGTRALLAGGDVRVADTLGAVCDFLNQKADLPRPASVQESAPRQFVKDLSEVKGQAHAKRALMICASGGHSMLMQGVPGAGKTLLASCLPSILPPLTPKEAIEVANIYSVHDVPIAFGVRPFRECHHSASAVALVGGGSRPRAGEITLAHLGVLFLDELPEFDRKTLEVLRQPLENKRITISRARGQVDYPADFQLIAAMNPCPCGYHGDVKDPTRCTCTPRQIAQYQAKLSGPLLDRIDLMINVPALPLGDLHAPRGEPSLVVRERVLKARMAMMARQNKPNATLGASELDTHAPLDNTAKNLLLSAAQKMRLSARGYHRVLRVARSIADLADSQIIKSEHIAEALGFRMQV